MRRRVRRSEPKSRRSRGRDDRGAVLVEAALLLPFLFALLFGIIDFGFTFNDWISVRQGGRDGLRQMIVNANPTPPAPSTTWAGAGCLQNGGPDSVTSAHAYSVMCFTKLRVGLDQSQTRVKVTFNTTNGYKAGQPVKICVQYKTSSLTGAYASLLNNKVLETQVESLIEQDDATMATFAETPIAGGPGWPASCDQL